MAHKSVIAVLLLIIAIATTPTIAAANYSYEFRDGSIRIDATNSMDFESLKQLDDELYYYVENTNLEYAVESIFCDTEDYKHFNLDYVVFRNPFRDSLYAESGEFSGEVMEVLNEYLNDCYSRSVCENCLPTSIQGRISNQGWIRLKCHDYDDGEAYVYVNISDNKVFRILQYEEYDDYYELINVSEKNLKAVDKMVGSITDDGKYDQVLLQRFINNPKSWEEAEDEEEFEFEFSIDSLIATVAVSIVAAIVKKNKKLDKSKVIKVERDKNKQVVINRTKQADVSQSVQDKSKAIVREAVSTNCNQTPRYAEDLKVLLKSGLITKNEYNEMINKKRRSLDD